MHHKSSRVIREIYVLFLSPESHSHSSQMRIVLLQAFLAEKLSFPAHGLFSREKTGTRNVSCSCLLTVKAKALERNAHAALDYYNEGKNSNLNILA